MNDKPVNDKPDNAVQQPDRLSLKRWSRRKLEAARAEAAPRAAAAPAEATTTPELPARQSSQAAGVATPGAPAPLPPIESLTIDSEFAAFFKPDVAEATKRAALKQLFRDPRFNIMDGLDVYIDDYTQSDPIPPEMMKQLLHTRHIFNPPRTEVNAQGHVVDVVDEPAAEQVSEAAGAIAASGATGAIATSSATGENLAANLPRAVDDAGDANAARRTDEPDPTR